MTVMELLVHPEALPACKRFLSPSFMNGFLYRQYVAKVRAPLPYALLCVVLHDFPIASSPVSLPCLTPGGGLVSVAPHTQWDSYVRYLFWARLAVLASYVVLTSLIASPSFFHPGGRAVGPPPEVSASLVVGALVLTAVIALIELIELGGEFGARDDGRKDKGKQALRMLVDRGGLALLLSIGCALVAFVWMLAVGVEEATHSGWVRLLLSLGAWLGWLTLLLEGYEPFPVKSTFVKVVLQVQRRVLVTEPRVL